MGGYELIMPFLPVQSKGGPYDDAAYVAGYEMGKLDGDLAQAGAHEPLTITVHRDNQEQADLIAMRHGYSTEFRGDNELGWVLLHLQPGSKP